MHLFARGQKQHLWHFWWDGRAWRGWQDIDLGGIITSAPSVVTLGAEMHVFARGQDDRLWHVWWDGRAWKGWQAIGGIITSDPGCATVLQGSVGRTH